MAASVRVALMVLVAILIASISYLITRLATAGVTDVGAQTITSGEVLEDIELISFANGERRGLVSLHEVFESGCGIMVFFLSTCPFCEEMAPKWSNVGSITTHGTHGKDLPIAWTTVSVTDTGAVSFIRRHDLAQPWYAIMTNNDRRSIGIDGWPTLYLLSEGGRFEGEINSRDPERLALDTVPCPGPDSEARAGAGR